MSKPRVDKAGQRLTGLGTELRMLVKRLNACNEPDAASEVLSIAQRMETVGADLTARRGQPHDTWREKARAKS